MIELVRSGRSIVELANEFMKAHQAEFQIKATCRLHVFTSGFYAWTSRTSSARDIEDQQL
jgi:hypothetical protein